MNNELSELISKAVAAALAAQTISNKESIHNQSLNCENAKPSTRLKMSTKRKITEDDAASHALVFWPDEKLHSIVLCSFINTGNDKIAELEKIYPIKTKSSGKFNNGQIIVLGNQRDCNDHLKLILEKLTSEDESDEKDDIATSSKKLGKKDIIEIQFLKKKLKQKECLL